MPKYLHPLGYVEYSLGYCRIRLSPQIHPLTIGRDQICLKVLRRADYDLTNLKLIIAHVDARLKSIYRSCSVIR